MDQLRAYNLAIDQLNKSGGILGMQIKATVGDDRTTADVARDNAQRMIERAAPIMAGQLRILAHRDQRADE